MKFKNNGSLTKSAILIILISAGGKFLGLARESALAAYFGASSETDAYKLAFGIPSILLFVISLGLATTFIPVYSNYLKYKTEKETRYFLNNIFSLVVVFSIGLTLAGILIAPYMVQCMAIGFDEATFGLTVKLTIISLPSIIFFAMFNLGSAYLESNSKFATPAMSWIIYDIIIIGSIVFLNKKGIGAIAAVSVFAVASLFLIQLPVIIRLGYRYRPVIDFKEKGFRKMLILTGPVIIGSAFNQIYVFIERMFASGLDGGSISALDYAYKVNSIVFNIFTLSIITVIYPKLALLSEEMESFKASLVKAIRAITLVSLPTMAFIAVLCEQVVSVLFQRGAFDAQDTKLTALALVGFSLGIIGMGLREIFNKAFYALKDTKTPMINGIFVICINILLSYLLVKVWGIGGLAAATSISAMISSCILFYYLRKKIGTIIGKESSIIIFKSLVAAVIMAIGVFLSNNFMGLCFLNRGVFIIEAGKLLMNMGIGAVIYICMLYILNVEELMLVVRLFQSLLNRHILIKRFAKG